MITKRVFISRGSYFCDKYSIAICGKVFFISVLTFLPFVEWESGMGHGKLDCCYGNSRCFGNPHHIPDQLYHNTRRTLESVVVTTRWQNIYRKAQ